MSDLDRQANIVGALALVLHDRMLVALSAVTDGQAETGAAALSALHHFLDRPSIDLLRQVLGLTPSGTVRLVDRLTAAGLVTREPGADGRSRTVMLTDEGRQVAERLSTARADVLRTALAGLAPDERAEFERLAGLILAGFVRGRGATRWACRLCDTDACGRAEGRCPTANAAARLHGPAAPN